MGLRRGYDKTKGKWFAEGLWFIRYYDTEEEMKADDKAFNDYIKRLKYFRAFVNMMTSCR